MILNFEDISRPNFCSFEETVKELAFKKRVKLSKSTDKFSKEISS